MRINITHNIGQVAAQMGVASKQVAYATAVALTKTAAKVRDAMPAALDKTFDRPTPFTRNGTYLVAARRDNLTAEVNFKDIQAKYLRLQADGGAYQPKAGGIRLPGNIVLNAFGNIPRGLIAKLKAAAQNGQLSAAIVKRLGVAHNRRKGAPPIQLFYGVPQGKGWESAPVGIWRRIPGASGGPGKLVPVIVFSDKPARYKKRLDMAAIATPIIAANFSNEFDAALRQALATARP